MDSSHRENADFTQQISSREATAGTFDVPVVMPAADHQRLSGRMGTFDVAFSVLAFNAPLSGVVGFVPAVIGFGNGLGAPSAYIGVGVLLLFFAVGFTTMSRYLPNPGAFYAYITAGLGREIGLGSAFLAVFSYLFVLVGAYCFGGIAAQSLVTSWGGPSIPWWIYVAVFVAAVAGLGYFRIDLSAKVLTVVMCLELAVVVIWDARVLIDGGPEGAVVNSFSPSVVMSGSLGVAILFCFSSFSGFEATAIFREEVRDPARTIPRATYLAVAFLAVLYAVAAYCMIVGVGPGDVVAKSAADPTGTSMASIEAYLGVVARDAATILLCTSIFASCLSIHNVGARYLYSLSVDRILPASLSGVHGRHGSPHRASIITSVIAVVFIAALVVAQASPTTLYATLVGIGGYALILLLLLTSIAIVPYLVRKRPDAVPLNILTMVIAPVVAAIGLAVAAYLGTTNITLLTGQSEAVSYTVVGVALAVFLLGVAIASTLRKRSPTVYRRIGRQAV